VIAPPQPLINDDSQDSQWAVSRVIKQRDLFGVEIVGIDIAIFEMGNFRC
jgi:hypothetical protein